MKSRKDEAWKQEWQADLSLEAKKTYRDLGLKPTTQIKSQPELSLWGGSLQPDPGTAALRIIMKGLDMRRQIYDVNVAIGGHNYIPSAAQMLGRIEIK